MDILKINYSLVIECITLIVLLLNIRKFSFNQSRFYLFSFIAVVITEVVATIAYIYYHNNRLIYFIGIDIFSVILLFIFYYEILKQKKLISILIFLHLGICIVFLFLLAFNTYGSKPVLGYNEILYSAITFIELIFILFVMVLFFYDTFNSNKILNLQYYFPFWVSVSILVVNAGLLPLMIASSFKNFVKTDTYGVIVLSINLIGYGIIIVGILLNKNINYNKNVRIKN